MSEWIVIYEQADDGSWSVRAADLPVYSVGATPEEAEASIREAIGEYLAFLRDHGQEVPLSERARPGVVSV